MGRRTNHVIIPQLLTSIGSAEIQVVALAGICKQVSAMAQTAALPQPASIDETLASFDSVPLFMKSLPQDDTDNEALDALQSLVFDGTPDGG